MSICFSLISIQIIQLLIPHETVVFSLPTNNDHVCRSLSSNGQNCFLSLCPSTVCVVSCSICSDVSIEFTTKLIIYSHTEFTTHKSTRDSSALRVAQLYTKYMRKSIVGKLIIFFMSRRWRKKCTKENQFP